MTPTAKLVYDLRRRHNESGRGNQGNLRLIDAVAYLSEAQGIWFSQLADVYETNAFSRGELRQFEQKEVELTYRGKTGDALMYAYPATLYKRLNQRARVRCTNECAGVEKDIPVTVDKTDKLNLSRINPFLKSSFSWERLLGDDAGHHLLIYPAPDTEIKSVTIDYLRKPEELHAPSLVDAHCTQQAYEDYAGRPITEDVNFEPQSRYSDRKIIEIALLLIKGDRKDYNAFQQILQQIIFGEQGLKN